MRGQIQSQQNGSLVRLHDQNWLDRQRKAGQVVAKTLGLLETLVKEKTAKSLLELDQIAEEFILQNDCTPTFKNYQGNGSKPFPNSVCISVNKQLVHGVATDYKLQDGDLVSFDLGATFEGAIGDAAVTCIFGEPKEKRHQQLVDDCKESLDRAIAAVAVGKRIGVIGNAISKFAQGKGYGIITNYGGHGIMENTPHAAPFVCNKASPNEGVVMQSGLSIAIEPQLTLGGTTTWVAEDGWTVNCESLSAHFEHTLFLHPDRVEIITARS
jgi:methionyl aminopeptidase